MELKSGLKLIEFARVKAAKTALFEISLIFNKKH